MLCREEITLVSAVSERPTVAPASSQRVISSSAAFGSSETRLRQAVDDRAQDAPDSETELDLNDPDIEVAPPTSRRFDTLRSLRAAPVSESVVRSMSFEPVSALTGCALNVEWGSFD